jgi:hypothetical protein
MPKTNSSDNPYQDPKSSTVAGEATFAPIKVEEVDETLIDMPGVDASGNVIKVKVDVEDEILEGAKETSSIDMDPYKSLSIYHPEKVAYRIAMGDLFALRELFEPELNAGVNLIKNFFTVKGEIRYEKINLYQQAVIDWLPSAKTKVKAHHHFIDQLAEQYFKGLMQKNSLQYLLSGEVVNPENLTSLFDTRSPYVKVVIMFIKKEYREGKEIILNEILHSRQSEEKERLGFLEFSKLLSDKITLPVRVTKFLEACNGVATTPPDRFQEVGASIRDKFLSPEKPRDQKRGFTKSNGAAAALPSPKAARLSAAEEEGVEESDESREMIEKLSKEKEALKTEVAQLRCKLEAERNERISVTSLCQQLSEENKGQKRLHEQKYGAMSTQIKCYRERFEGARDTLSTVQSDLRAQKETHRQQLTSAVEKSATLEKTIHELTEANRRLREENLELRNVVPTLYAAVAAQTARFQENAEYLSRQAQASKKASQQALGIVKRFFPAYSALPSATAAVQSTVGSARATPGSGAAAAGASTTTVHSALASRSNPTHAMTQMLPGVAPGLRQGLPIHSGSPAAFVAQNSTTLFSPPAPPAPAIPAASMALPPHTEESQDQSRDHDNSQKP